jgi:hypothetical protein
MRPGLIRSGSSVFQLLDGRDSVIVYIHREGKTESGEVHSRYKVQDCAYESEVREA